MSTITETQFIELLTQTESRFASNKSKPRFLLPQDTDDEDQGLVMRLDSKLSQKTKKSVPVPAKLCGQAQSVAGMALTSASLLQTMPDSIMKRVNQLNQLLQKEAARLLPVLLYASLMLLGLQALTIVFLLVNSILPLGLWFLLTCGAVLGSLYCHTSNLGVSQLQTPPPTPSHSSTSLSSFAS